MSTNWNVPPPTYDSPSSASDMSSALTPYLQLSHLLSLTWLAYPILSLIFVAFRLQLSLGDAQNAVASAKDDLLASCKAAEHAATSTASMPRYMALASNRQFADAVNGSMNAARAALVLALTVMEAIINFIVDIYRSTFLCFLELVIRGGLAILIGAVEEINNILSTVTASLRTSIQSDISSANSVITSAINAINKVNPFGKITPPQITVPSLDSLQNVSLPSSFTDALTNLNNSIPSIADLKGKINDVLDTPFELLKKDINDTFANITFDSSVLPVPEQTRLSFCNELDTSVIDDIGRDFIKTAKIGVVILVLLTLLLVGLNCLLTWYKWRCMKKHLQYTREAWISDPTMVHMKPTSSSPQITMSDHNLLMLQANSEHPLITRIMNQLSAKFHLTPTQHANTQWFLHYIFHPPALACFLIGFFGLLSVEIQLLAMGPLVAKFQDRAASTVTDFSTLIATNINNSMYNQSSLYANDINGRVDLVQSTINDGLFGWVNGTTTTLNDTINAFYTDVQDAVNTVFGGTILQSPIDDFIKCFIGSKVDAIETALTFLHDNLIVDIPRVNQSALVLSPESINEASQPIAAAAIGGGSGDNEGVIGRLLNAYAASLKKERIMFGIFMGLWGFVVLMGLCVLAWHSIVRPYLDRRGRRKWEAEQRSGIDTFGSYRSGSTDEKRNHFSSFSPLPSPKGSAFKPFWGSRSNSPFPSGLNHSASSSEESVVPNRNNQEPSFPGAFPEPQSSLEPVEKKTGANKLLAIGRKAIRRERLKKDGSEEELAVPLSPSYISAPEESEVHKKNSAWYSKMGNLFAKKETPMEQERSVVPLWDPPAMTETENTRPKLQVYTQRGLDKYGPPPSSSRYYSPPFPPPPAAHQPDTSSSSPPETPRPTWGNIMTPTPVVVVSQEPEVPLSSTFPQPPVGVPIRPRHHIVSLPNDVGPVYEESVRRAPPPPPVLPVPLYNGFENRQTPRSHPQHPQLAAYGRKRQGSSPPPPLKSPRMYQPHTALAPPSHPDRHRRSSSMGTTSQWRVTNAVPGESPRSSTASLEQQNRRNDANLPTTPVTRMLTTTHARQSSNVNPFITPFDDEHQVVIDYPTGPGTRKSIPTNPFVHAM